MVVSGVANQLNTIDEVNTSDLRLSSKSPGGGVEDLSGNGGDFREGRDKGQGVELLVASDVVGAGCGIGGASGNGGDWLRGLTLCKLPQMGESRPQTM
ncbi:hypothetical protein PCASD_04889 [Puccinia coronata f. sp. avenae]|uniref:Uncharacterized protein n=1 Tax=Puccinia coronata f. sp. avenae TaxID=200324 RepID=A0A2N5V207_9BASI|nr:hypothetical protein PCASD_04889 [Puccinia coronata f. sp. avenae]